MMSLLVLYAWDTAIVVLLVLLLVVLLVVPNGCQYTPARTACLQGVYLLVVPLVVLLVFLLVVLLGCCAAVPSPCML
jgi:hypothetical protein